MHSVKNAFDSTYFKTFKIVIPSALQCLHTRTGEGNVHSCYTLVEQYNLNLNFKTFITTLQNQGSETCV